MHFLDSTFFGPCRVSVSQLAGLVQYAGYGLQGKPKMEVVTEHLLHEERKQNDQAGASTSGEEAMTTKR